MPLLAGDLIYYSSRGTAWFVHTLVAITHLNNRRNIMKTLIPFTLLMTAFELAYSQSGLLDTTFNPPAGYAIISFISGSATAYNYGKSIIIQPDGKFVFAGYSSSDGIVSKFSVARFNDTISDTTFGTMGQVTTAIGTTNDFANSAAIQIDGRIVVAGSSSNGSNSDFAVVRYNTDGTLDATFSDNGKVTTPIGTGNDDGTSVAIQKDGKIVVGGFSRVGSYYDFAVVRYNTDGSIDSTFSGDGKVTTAFDSYNDKGYSVAIQADGKIVLAGYTVNVSNDDIAVARYNTDGSLDSTFSGDGKVTTAVGSSIDHGWSVAIQEDQKIVVAGECYINSTNDFAVVRYNSDGSLDATFDGDGKVTTPVGLGLDVGYSVAIQADDKIVVAGYSNVVSTANFAVVRYNSNGNLDTTFSGDGKVTTEVGKVVLLQ